jgi:hypothetical protein
VRTVEAMDPTVCVDALASRRIVKSFSAGNDSLGSSVQSSCSYCWRLVLIQNLHTRYVTTAITATPPTTPPAIAPTFGPEPEDLLELLIDVEDEDSATQVVLWHASQLIGTSEHI